MFSNAEKISGITPICRSVIKKQPTQEVKKHRGKLRIVLIWEKPPKFLQIFPGKNISAKKTRNTWLFQKTSMTLLFIEINPGEYVCQKLKSTLLLKKKTLQPKGVQKHILTPVESYQCTHFRKKQKSICTTTSRRMHLCVCTYILEQKLCKIRAIKQFQDS